MDPTGGHSPSGGELEGVEQLLIRVRRTAVELGALLASDPFSAETMRRLRDFLDEEADEAVEAFAALSRLPERTLLERITQVRTFGQAP